MSKSIRRLERGAADLVSVAVGLTIIAITVVGTSYSLLYGRQALIHQEHYRAALYKLRGFMEEETARLKFSQTYQADLNWQESPNELQEFALDLPTDRDGDIQVTTARIYRERFDEIDVPTTTRAPDYYRITGKAEWQEAGLAGFGDDIEDDFVGPNREITLTATILLPN